MVGMKVFARAPREQQQLARVEQHARERARAARVARVRAHAAADEQRRERVPAVFRVRN